MADNIRLFSGYDFFLILKNGRLYGIGSNSCRQISRDSVPYYSEPVFIADNVVSAWAGKEYSAFVNTSGDIIIKGSGTYADKPLHIDGAESIFVSQSNQFLIGTRGGEFYGFGNNLMQKICPRKTETVYEKKDNRITAAYGTTITQKYNSYYHTMGYAVRTDEDNLQDVSAKVIDDFKETDIYKKLYQENDYRNVDIKTTVTEYHYDEEKVICHAVVDLTADITNCIITNPVRLQENEAQQLKAMKNTENGTAPAAAADFGFTKLLLNARNAGLAINRDSVLMTADTESGTYALPRAHFDRVTDIAVSRGEEYEDNFIVLTRGGELLTGSLSRIFPIVPTAGNMFRDTLANALFTRNREKLMGGVFDEFAIRRLTLPEG